METIAEKRWFLRCRGCLSVMATNAVRPASGIRCSACGDSIEVMGMVKQERLVQTAVRCPCDLRCTMAAGPDCNCQCGGKNHGSQITVAVVVDKGGIPKITPVNPEKARRVYGEWIQAKNMAEERILRHYPSAAHQGQVADAFNKSQALRRRLLMDAVSRAGILKTHHGRLKALAAIQERISKAAR